MTLQVCLFSFQTRDRLFVCRVCLDISRFCRLKIALYVVLYLVTRDIFVLCPLNGEAFFLRSDLCDGLLCGQYLEGLANSSLVIALARDGNFRLADCGVGRILDSVINVLFQCFAIQSNSRRGLLSLAVVCIRCGRKLYGSTGNIGRGERGYFGFLENLAANRALLVLRAINADSRGLVYYPVAGFVACRGDSLSFGLAAS